MQTNFKTTLILIAGVLALCLTNVVTAAGKTYTEDEFLNHFSGKSKKLVISKLGAPAKKQLSVKPTNAGAIIGKNVEPEKGKKPVVIEMWYYKSIVRYDPKNTYKETEITFVNDRVMNIAFFNNR